MNGLSFTNLENLSIKTNNYGKSKHIQDNENQVDHYLSRMLEIRKGRKLLNKIRGHKSTFT